MGLLLRFAVTAVAVGGAAYFVPGINTGDDSWKAILLTAIVLGIINALIKPIIKLFSLPLILMTLGLFTLVINCVCFYAAAWISRTLFDVQFSFDGVVAVFLGALVISVVSTVLNWIVPDN